MENIINLIIQNGLGVVCVGYLIYFQNNIMTKMLETLNAIETRLAVIEDKIDEVEHGNG